MPVSFRHSPARNATMRPLLLLLSSLAGAEQPAYTGKPRSDSSGLLPDSPVKVCFELPGTHTGTVGVTVVATDPDDQDWIVSHLSYAQPFNVTAGAPSQGCITWDGLDENFWPVPAGSYGLKGIVTNLSFFAADKQFHALVPKFVGAVSPVPVDINATADKQMELVQGDATGNSFTSIGVSANFPERPDYANLYHGYLENAFNNYLLNISKPHNFSQSVARWHDAGLGGGDKTATNGHSVWSSSNLGKAKVMYRADIGDENVAAWGNCNASVFYAFPGLFCLPAGVSVADMEVVRGSGFKPLNGSTAVVLWVLAATVNSTNVSLTAYDGYARHAPVLHQLSLANAASMAVRNSMITLLHTDGTVRRLALDQATGLPVAGSSPQLAFNLSQLLNLSAPAAGQTPPPAALWGPVAVDAMGTTFVHVNQHQIHEVVAAVNSSNQLLPGSKGLPEPQGLMSVTNPEGGGRVPVDSHGKAMGSPFGVRAMTTRVDPGTGRSKLMILEDGGPRRYLQYDMGNASAPSMQPRGRPIDQVWNDIAAGTNTGWVYSPSSRDFAFVMKGSAGQKPTVLSTARWGDLVKLRTNATDGDWQIDTIYAGIGANFMLTPDQPLPASHMTGGSPHLLVTYCVFQKGFKSIYKYNETKDQWVPSAGMVLDVVNETSNNQKHAVETIQPFVWHDTNDDGTWLLGTNGDGGPDWNELRVFQMRPESSSGLAGKTAVAANFDYFCDLVQDDFSFLGPTLERRGFWQWEAKGFDDHGNPIYENHAVSLVNDTVLQARYEFNASTDSTPCKTCAGLPPVRGGNEVSTNSGDHVSARFTNADHTHIVMSLGTMGSEFMPAGCFSADSCPQWKMAMYTRNSSSSGEWQNKWRAGRAPISFDNGG